MAFSYFIAEKEEKQSKNIQLRLGLDSCTHHADFNYKRT